MKRIYATLVTLLLTAILATGCSSKYKQTELEGNDSIKLDPKASVYIGSPQKTNYKGSDTYTTLAIKQALSKHNIKNYISKCDNFDVCLDEAINKPYVYLIMPDILQWEDRATEWSGKPDRIEIKLSVYNINNRESLRAVILKASSKWATFGGDHPQDLLPEPVGKFVDSLY